MRDSLKKKITIICVTSIILSLIFCGCGEKRKSAAERYIDMGEELIEKVKPLGVRSVQYSKSRENYVYTPSNSSSSESVPFLSFIGDVPENSISAERSITLDFSHELYRIQDGGQYGLPYLPLVGDNWTLKNNTAEEITVKVAYPFTQRGKEASPFTVNGETPELTFAAAATLNFGSGMNYDSHSLVLNMLNNGDALKEALSDNYKTDEELIVYEITVNETTDFYPIFVYTYSPKTTFFCSDRTIPIEQEDDPVTYGVELNRDNTATVYIIGEEPGTPSIMKAKKDRYWELEPAELPKDSYTIKKSVISLDEFLDSDSSEYLVRFGPFSALYCPVPDGAQRQINGYCAKQYLINYFTINNREPKTETIMPMFIRSLRVIPIVFYISELTIPAGGETKIEISYIDYNAFFHFPEPETQPYDLEKTDITIIKNDTMIITQQNLGLELDGEKLVNDVTTVTLDSLKPGYYFEYRDLCEYM